MILEDGHWADTPTLLLLRHLARTATDARILVLATFRDTEVDVPAELADTLADLRRADDVVRLKLGGLTEDEIAEFVKRAAGGDADPVLDELAGAIARPHGRQRVPRVRAVACAARDRCARARPSGARLVRPLEEVATPESVREVVSQRVARLDAATRDLLELAAVAGQEFELETLQRAAPGTLELPSP